MAVGNGGSNRGKSKYPPFTEDDLKKISGMAAVRLPHEHIARIMGMDHDAFERRIKKSAALRAALLDGRANASGTYRTTAYRLATERRKVEVVTQKTYLRKGKEVTVKSTKVHWEEPDASMVQFWGKTQEGFVSTEKVELSGPDGKAIEVKKVDPEKRKEILEKLNKSLKLTEDE